MRRLSAFMIVPASETGTEAARVQLVEDPMEALRLCIPAAFSGIDSVHSSLAAVPRQRTAGP
jgi:hypothetical protein